MSSDTTCAICWCDLHESPISEMSCKHTFHSACLDKWEQGSNQCPYCRHDIKNDKEALDTTLANIMSGLLLATNASNKIKAIVSSDCNLSETMQAQSIIVMIQDLSNAIQDISHIILPTETPSSQNHESHDINHQVPMYSRHVEYDSLEHESNIEFLTTTPIWDSITSVIDAFANPFTRNTIQQQQLSARRVMSSSLIDTMASSMIMFLENIPLSQSDNTRIPVTVEPQSVRVVDGYSFMQPVYLPDVLDSSQGHDRLTVQPNISINPAINPAINTAADTHPLTRQGNTFTYGSL